MRRHGPAHRAAGELCLTAGYAPDFSPVDLWRRQSIEPSWVVSPWGWILFAATNNTGGPVAAIVRRNPMMREDEVQGTPAGRVL